MRTHSLFISVKFTSRNSRASTTLPPSASVHSWVHQQGAFVGEEPGEGREQDSRVSTTLSRHQTIACKAGHARARGTGEHMSEVQRGRPQQPRQQQQQGAAAALVAQQQQ